MQKALLKAKIGFGTYKICDQNDMDQALKNVLKNNYGFIDTAKLYNNESLIGKALEKLQKTPCFFTPPLIQSKVWPSDFKNGIKTELMQSLQRLKIPKINSYLLHRPHVDNTMNVQAWKELIACQKQGLVEVIGVSNFEPDMIRILYNETGFYPQLVQNEASLTYIRRDRMRFCSEHGIIMQGWRPLGNQQVNFNDGFIQTMAQKYHCSIAQLLLAYVCNLGFCPVVKSTVASQIQENTQAIKIQIKQTDMLALELKFNTHKSTTHNECDSYANLALNDDWYQTN